MKKTLSVIFVTSLCFGVAFAAIPPVNQYKIEKRPIAVEPIPAQYSISESDAAVVGKPPFVFYTQLNRTAPKDCLPPRYLRKLLGIKH